MSYETDAAFRAALEARLANRARDSGVDLNRLRRRVVFERLLARLDDSDRGRWVLKGGMALEVRWRDRARSTRDLDLAVRDSADDERGVRTRLANALATDVGGDRFEFAVGQARPLREDEAGRPGWRLPIEARLAGRPFASVTVDVVVRPEESNRTERLPLPGSLAFAGVPAGEVEVVDRTQHFAEKLHALTRTYAGGASTRVRDLVDIILLIDDGVRPDAQTAHVVRQVFDARGTHAVPRVIGDPPPDWNGRYAELARDLDVTAHHIDQAMAMLRDFWSRLRTED